MTKSLFFIFSFSFQKHKTISLKNISHEKVHLHLQSSRQKTHSHFIAENIPPLLALVTMCDLTIDIESLQNSLHKVCYVLATSAGLNGLLFFFFFTAAINSTNEANKAGGTRHLAVYFT
jgi:hypothetical protein